MPDADLKNAAPSAPPLAAADFGSASREEMSCAAQPQSLRRLLTSDRTTKFLVENSGERAEALLFEYAARGLPRQVFRWAGWANNTGEYARHIPLVAAAFTEVKGFHNFGGTQIYDLDTGILRPSANDIPVALKQASLERCPPGSQEDVVLIGVVPKVESECRYLRNMGLVTKVDAETGYFTMVSDVADMAVMIQPDVNNAYTWMDQVKEGARQCCRLMEKGWTGTLVVFGGSPTPQDAMRPRNVEQEIRMWAQAAAEHPDWRLNIILLKGSGGAADQFAANLLMPEAPFREVWSKAQSLKDVADYFGVSGMAANVRAALLDLGYFDEIGEAC